jgi:fluoride exporter
MIRNFGHSRARLTLPRPLPKVYDMAFLEALTRHPYVTAGLGGAIGSVGRVVMTDLVTRWTGDRFPFGTVAVNITGALLMGLLAGYGETDPGKLVFSQPARSFLMIGILGGYTTFSSFSLQTFLLFEQGNVTGALLNMLLSVILCVLGVWAGFSLIRACS